MADSPEAEYGLTEAQLRELLRADRLAYAEDPLTLIASGWDNDIWRLGDRRAARVPRRGLADQLLRNEQRALPAIAQRLAPSGVTVPAPLHIGAESELFPHPWSVVPWVSGVAAGDRPRRERSVWAADLAHALRLLHISCGSDAPINPYRGVPLAERAETDAARFAAIEAPVAARVAWEQAVAAPAHAGPPVWIHGDLHPGNLVIDGPRLAAIVDFGDVAGGDPAYDLAAAWLLFDSRGRQLFIERTAIPDDALWMRARGWAAAVGAILLAQSDDRPDYAALGTEILTEVAADS
ncbi:aminoglycoside phosphotransferase family protein [Microbacterium sp. ZW T5_56]|uniref:aminoglycoside phosphotransferase family protein n=1 Tax=Microbacterium sp. ZW T5_56 TaxID=3378081 RepID=UPI003854F42D